MKVHEIKMKKMYYKNSKLYALNNIDKEKLNENSEFLIGSLTKVFTAILLLKLHQEKKININNTFKKYLDNKELANVKIIDVMNHVSGFKEIHDGYDYKGIKKKYNNSTEVYNDFKNEKLIKHKKGIFAYSNIGYIFLGALIESVTNMTYEEVVYKNILDPLKMNHTGFDKTNITLYTNNNNIPKKLTNRQNNERMFAGSAGGFKTSISNLIKFKNFPKLLNKQSLKLLQIIYFFENNKDNKTYNINHGGDILGGSANLNIIYDSNWKFKDINITVSTIR